MFCIFGAQYKYKQICYSNKQKSMQEFCDFGHPHCITIYEVRSEIYVFVFLSRTLLQDATPTIVQNVIFGQELQSGVTILYCPYKILASAK